MSHSGQPASAPIITPAIATQCFMLSNMFDPATWVYNILQLVYMYMAKIRVNKMFYYLERIRTLTLTRRSATKFWRLAWSMEGPFTCTLMPGHLKGMCTLNVQPCLLPWLQWIPSTDVGLLVVWWPQHTSHCLTFTVCSQAQWLHKQFSDLLVNNFKLTVAVLGILKCYMSDANCINGIVTCGMLGLVRDFNPESKSFYKRC